MAPLEQFTSSVHTRRHGRLPDARPRRGPGPSGTGSRSSTASTSPSPRRSTGAWTTGQFTDARAAITLDVRFAERYLDAVEAVADERRPPACWRPAASSSGAIPEYARCSSRSRASMRTSDTIWRSRSWTPVVRSAANRPSWRTSSTAWAIVLVSLEERIREDLMPGPDLLQIADPLTHLLGAWSLDRARDARLVGGPGAVGAARTPRSRRGVRRAARHGGRPGRPVLLTPLSLRWEPVTAAGR